MTRIPRWRQILLWIAALLLAACEPEPTPVNTPFPAGTPPADFTPTVVAPAPQEGTAVVPPAPSALPLAQAFPVEEPARYRRLPSPLVPRQDGDGTAFLEEGFGLQSGSYRLEYTGDRFLIFPEGGELALSLTLPGGEALNLLAADPALEQRATDAGEQLLVSGQSGWGARYQATIFAYARHPGLFRWRLELLPGDAPPAGAEPELEFVQRETGAQASGGLDIYAEPSPLAAPQLYGYTAALDSTLFYWVDLTALNPFMQAAHFTPSATPRRQGQRFGHSFTRTDLQSQPRQSAVAIYDSYLYLSPGQPAGADERFSRYLHALGDIYDLMAVPKDPLADWFGFYEWDGQGVPQGIHAWTIRDLAAEENWVELDGKPYLRAYVADTRRSAEAISQLDVYTALARYRLRFGDAPEYFSDLRAAIPDFFNPDFGPAGMFQNSGPLSVTGPQERGDTWYELGHALKVAELALWSPQDRELRELAVRSGETWIDFARSVEYRFPRFYAFGTWRGTGREPDATGAYAYLMLLLGELTGEQRFQDQARAALLALYENLGEDGFRLAYETHMTAITAAAAARFHQLEPDPRYLEIINAATANLLRLSWLWECDYGSLQEQETQVGSWWIDSVRQRTFFGLNPTQQSAAITPKEQYEAWIYLVETLQRAHGVLDPTVEKLLAEFASHTLLTIPRSLPPFLPAEAVTAHPSAYPTVPRNNLSQFIPLEDLRDGWDVSGAIGQEIYGAGMAPALAALALVEVRPGLVIYSAYPLAEITGQAVTFAGIPGTLAPVAVQGAARVRDARGQPVETQPCGQALCFSVEGGGIYTFDSQ